MAQDIIQSHTSILYERCPTGMTYPLFQAENATGKTGCRYGHDGAGSRITQKMALHEPQSICR